MSNLLALAVNAAKDHSFNWLIAASLPPFLYLFANNKKFSWFQNILIKWVVKRAEKRARKGKNSVSKENRQIIALFIIAGLIGTIVGLLIKSGGLTIISVIALIIGIGWALAGNKLH